MLEETVSLTCPYCGEYFDISIDCTAGNQSYIEDCQICCRPVELKIECDQDGKLGNVMTRRDDD